MNELTKQDFLDNEFTEHSVLGGYERILDDKSTISPISGESNYHFKSIRIIENNTHDYKEYYVYMREGTSHYRYKDDVVLLRNDLRYKEQLENLLNGLLQ